MDQHNTPRRYTLRIEVEVRDQDDFQHFQPNTVTGHAPQLGFEWVSANDAEALGDFFRFIVNWSHVKDPEDALKGVQEIARRALDPLKVDWMEAAEIEHRRVLELESQNADMRDAMRDAAAELEHMADALDIDMPSDSGYVERVQKLARTLRAESEGSTDA